MMLTRRRNRFTYDKRQDAEALAAGLARNPDCTQIEVKPCSQGFTVWWTETSTD